MYIAEKCSRIESSISNGITTERRINGVQMSNRKVKVCEKRSKLQWKYQKSQFLTKTRSSSFGGKEFERKEGKSAERDEIGQTNEQKLARFRRGLLKIERFYVHLGISELGCVYLSVSLEFGSLCSWIAGVEAVVSLLSTQFYFGRILYMNKNSVRSLCACITGFQENLGPLFS